MLRVRLEIVPGGDERRAKEIGRLNIANRSDLAEVSDYTYECWPGPEERGGDVWGGTLRGHRRSEGALELLRKILNQHAEPTIAPQEAPEAQEP